MATQKKPAEAAQEAAKLVNDNYLSMKDQAQKSAFIKGFCKEVIESFALRFNKQYPNLKEEIKAKEIAVEKKAIQAQINKLNLQMDKLG